MRMVLVPSTPVLQPENSGRIADRIMMKLYLRKSDLMSLSGMWHIVWHLCIAGKESHKSQVQNTLTKLAKNFWKSW